jgi:ADP-heptose:LPS heptosyltransferase
MMGLVVGGPSEATAAARLCDDEHTNLRDLTGQGSAASYWKIFKNAQFTVANDSGLAHVAALCGSPVQVIWGAGNPKRTEPLGPGKVKLIFQPIDCWPCERNECSQPLELKYQCLKSIQPEIVWKEILSGIRPRITHKKS